MTRRAMILTSLAFLLGAVLGRWLLPPLWGQARRAVLQTKDLKRVDLGSWCEGKEATIQLLEFGPGTSDKHYHPAHSFAYVLDCRRRRRTGPIWRTREGQAAASRWR